MHFFNSRQFYIWLLATFRFLFETIDYKIYLFKKINNNNKRVIDSLSSILTFSCLQDFSNGRIIALWWTETESYYSTGSRCHLCVCVHVCECVKRAGNCGEWMHLMLVAFELMRLFCLFNKISSQKCPLRNPHTLIHRQFLLYVILFCYLL